MSNPNEPEPIILSQEQHAAFQGITSVPFVHVSIANKHNIIVLILFAAYQKKTASKKDREKVLRKKLVLVVAELCQKYKEISDERTQISDIGDLKAWVRERVEEGKELNEEDRRQYFAKGERAEYRLIVENSSIFLALDMNKNLSQQTAPTLADCYRLIESKLADVYTQRGDVKKAVASRFGKIKSKLTYAYKSIVQTFTKSQTSLHRLLMAEVDDDVVGEIDALVAARLERGCKIIGKMWSSVFSQSSSIAKNKTTMLQAWQLQNGRKFEKKKVKKGKKAATVEIDSADEQSSDDPELAEHLMNQFEARVAKKRKNRVANLVNERRLSKRQKAEDVVVLDDDKKGEKAEKAEKAEEAEKANKSADDEKGKNDGKKGEGDAYARSSDDPEAKKCRQKEQTYGTDQVYWNRKRSSRSSRSSSSSSSSSNSDRFSLMRGRLVFRGTSYYPESAFIDEGRLLVSIDKVYKHKPGNILSFVLFCSIPFFIFTFVF
jgi:hypothetical protein